MKKIMIIVAAAISILTGTVMKAQNTESNDNQATVIRISEPEGLKYDNAAEILKNCLVKAAGLNRMETVEDRYSRYDYQIDTKANTISINTTTTAPVKYIVELEILFTTTDTASGSIISQSSFNVKGVATSEAKAYMQAIRQVNPRSIQIKRMFDKIGNR